MLPIACYWALTNIGDDASKDDLGLAEALHCGAEFGIVPGVDFAMSLDERCAWVHVKNLLWQLSVWSYEA
jgi:hypothetical protein